MTAARLFLIIGKRYVLLVGADSIRPAEGTSEFAETLGEIVTCCRMGG